MKLGIRTAATVCAVITVLALIVNPSPASADPSTGNGDRVEHSAVVTSKPLPDNWKKQLQALTPSGKLVTPLLDPPMGGCQWNLPENMYLRLYWWYENNVLTTVDGEFRSNVLCTTTAPGQTLKILTDVARLNYNFNFVEDGLFYNCQVPPNAVCNQAQSVGFYSCAGSVNCAGTYQLFHFTQMTLPDGWLWTSWPTSSCVDLDQQQTLVCTWSTGTILVPVTG